MKKKVICSMFVLFIILSLFAIAENDMMNISVSKKRYQEGINQKANDYLISKANGLDITEYEDGNTEEMYTFSHEATLQTDALLDYRYIGDNPNNYVYFNCSDANNTDTCELWRIIGVFEVENANGVKEKRVKLVKNQSIGAFAWNDSGSNEWGNSSLNKYLNESYFESLSSESQSMIDNTKYYLNGVNYDSQIGYGLAEDIYNSERGITSANDKMTNYIGKVGLMYLSDYAYTYKFVNSKCYMNIQQCGALVGGLPKDFYDSLTARSWIGTSVVFHSWLINSVINSDNEAISIIGKAGTQENIENVHHVRPVLYLKSDVYIKDGNGSKSNPYILSLDNKNSENSENSENNISYKEYKIGEIVTYNGEEFYVIKNSSSKTNYVTLLKKDVLSKMEIYYYSQEKYYKDIPYYYSDTCSSKENESGCVSNYSQSLAKEVVDNWALEKLNLDDLVEVDGYKTRLITKEELFDYLGYDHNQMATSEYLMKTEDTPEWIYGISYWTMSSYDDSISSVFRVREDGNVFRKSVYESSAIRPVINLNKCVLDGGCLYNDSELNCTNGIKYKTEKVTKYNSFNIGDEVEYNDELYYVIEDSDNKQKYLTLLKANPLTKEELYKYGRDESNDLFINKNIINLDNPEQIIYEYENGIGGMAYYTSDTCGYQYSQNGSDFVVDNEISSGCLINYKNSDIKKVIDNWGNSLGEDLIKVNGYKVRLITDEDLLDNLGYVYEQIGPSGYGYVYTEDTPAWVYNSNYTYWTMNSFDSDSAINVYVLNNYGFPEEEVVYKINAVRPVINLDKCAVNGGCFEEEVQVEECIGDDIISNDNTSVTVANTLKTVSNVVLIVSLLLITGGITILGYNYYKMKQEKK